MKNTLEIIGGLIIFLFVMSLYGAIIYFGIKLLTHIF